MRVNWPSAAALAVCSVLSYYTLDVAHLPLDVTAMLGFSIGVGWQAAWPVIL